MITVEPDKEPENELFKKNYNGCFCCKYFKDEGAHYRGWCLRHAPDGSGGFPRMHYGEWCGDFFRMVGRDWTFTP